MNRNKDRRAIVESRENKSNCQNFGSKQFYPPVFCLHKLL